MKKPKKDIKFVICMVCLNICGADWGICPNCQEPLPEEEKDG